MQCQELSLPTIDKKNNTINEPWNDRYERAASCEGAKKMTEPHLTQQYSGKGKRNFQSLKEITYSNSYDRNLHLHEQIHD